MDWMPAEGDRVEVRAQATIYEPRGDYQLLVEAMRRAGQGALYEEFVQLKQKLESEGLFQVEHKLSLPRIPQQIGIITSLQAAALQDVLRTLELRWPGCPVIIYPAPVQGNDAAQLLRQSLLTAISRNECDVLLMVRGGGSLEDLRAFNDEKLARTIYSSPIPVITGVGHETDFCIADFVADVRAATPTAAAQLSVPDRNDIEKRILNSSSQIKQIITRHINQHTQYLDGLTRRVSHPGNAISNMLINIAQIKHRLRLDSIGKVNKDKRSLINLMTRLGASRPNIEARHNQLNGSTKALKKNIFLRFERQRSKLESFNHSLDQLNPVNVLARGYCITLDETNSVIKNSHALHLGSKIQVVLNSGKFGATVDEIAHEPPERKTPQRNP